MTSNKLISQEKDFFAIKKILTKRLEQVEKEHFSQRKVYEEIFELCNKLDKIVEKTDSLYFKIKLKTLKEKVDDLIDKKSYNKQDFDRIFFQLNKLKETDSVEFLNQALKSRLDKIVQKNIVEKNIDKAKLPVIQKEKQLNFFSFSYQMVHFFCEDKYLKEVKRDMETFNDCVELDNQIYPIFPNKSFGLEQENETTLENILAIYFDRTPTCFRFDSLEGIFQISKNDFTQLLKKTTFSYHNIKYYIQKKGLKYYFIDESFIT